MKQFSILGLAALSSTAFAQQKYAGDDAARAACVGFAPTTLICLTEVSFVVCEGGNEREQFVFPDTTCYKGKQGQWKDSIQGGAVPSQSSYPLYSTVPPMSTYTPTSAAGATDPTSSADSSAAGATGAASSDPSSDATSTGSVAPAVSGFTATSTANSSPSSDATSTPSSPAAGTNTSPPSSVVAGGSTDTATSSGATSDFATASAAA